jgi:hypothetical protein
MPRRRLLVLALAVLLSLSMLWLRMATVPRVIEHPDGFNFVNGVVRYSVAVQRPHFPGYPVYIWLGKLMTTTTADPVRALHLLSILVSTLLLWPTALVARAFRRAIGGGETDGIASGLLAAGTLALTPLFLTLGSEIFADPTALCLAVGMLWCCALALERGEKGGAALVAAGALAGLTPGARLTYVGLLLPFGCALLLTPLRGRRLLGMPVRLAAGLAFLLVVLVWVTWQFARDGWRLAAAARIHVVGHFNTWGGSVIDDPEPLLRPLRLLNTLVVSGLGAWGRGFVVPRLLIVSTLVPLLLVGAARLLRSRERWPLWLVLAWLVPYSVGFALGHDPGQPRHSLPYLPVLAIVAGLGLPARRGPAAALGLALVASLGAISLPVAFKERETPRLSYRVTQWLIERPTSERPVLLVDQDQFPLLLAARQQLAADGFRVIDAKEQLAEARGLHAEGRSAYALEPTAEAPDEWVPVARLCRGEILDTAEPAELWLLRYDPRGWRGPLPDCP